MVAISSHLILGNWEAACSKMEVTASAFYLLLVVATFLSSSAEAAPIIAETNPTAIAIAVALPSHYHTIAIAVATPGLLVTKAIAIKSAALLYGVWNSIS